MGRAASRREKRAPQPGGTFLDYRPAGDKAVDDDNHRNYEQEVNQPSTHMHDEEPKNPKDEENNRDGPKHIRILARSESHPARQKMYPACDQPAFGWTSAWVVHALATSMPLRNDIACYGDSTRNNSLCAATS
jgi:hypothetical protein